MLSKKKMLSNHANEYVHKLAQKLNKCLSIYLFLGIKSVKDCVLKSVVLNFCVCDLNQGCCDSNLIWIMLVFFFFLLF